jgi:hypothetical protein
MTDDKQQKQVDELIKHDRRITQKQIAGSLGMSKERVGYIIGLLGYTKVCSQWVPCMLTPEKKQKRVEICELLLKRYRKEGDQFLLNIVTCFQKQRYHICEMPPLGTKLSRVKLLPQSDLWGGGCF